MQNGLTAWWPALLVWSAALAGLWLTAYLSGHSPWLSGTWAHWDSGHYAEIVRHGYEVHRCNASEGAATWCGDAAWFPGYPVLVAGLATLGFPILASGIAISWLLSVMALVLLWHTFLRSAPKVVAAGGLLYAAWAPGQIYEYAVFPLSLLLLSTVAYLYLLHRERWLLAGLAGSVAVLAYPIGVTLAMTGMAWIVLTLSASRLRAVAQSGGPSTIALLGIVAVQRVQTGRWSAFLDVQRGYGHGFHNPFGVTWNALLLVIRNPHLDLENATSLQTLTVSAVLVAVLLHTALRWRLVTRLELLLVIWALITWAFPLTQANVSIWRSQAALTPVAVLVARLPRPLLALAVVGAVAVSVPVARLYFAGRLI
ncbi:MAG: hypothetical protein JWM06_1956 [Actinomycetia bacterium]|nr:hypothetical protein [Actinomycetes bacterium]